MGFIESQRSYRDCNSTLNFLQDVFWERERVPVSKWGIDKERKKLDLFLPQYNAWMYITSQRDGIFLSIVSHQTQQEVARYTFGVHGHLACLTRKSICTVPESEIEKQLQVFCPNEVPATDGAHR